MDIALLRSFIAITEYKSLTKAAAHIGRTQSAISQQIAKLEEVLGVSVFNRTGRQLILSSQGELVLHYAQNILALYDEMVSRCKTPQYTGEIRFGLPEDFASVFLSDILRLFNGLHPSILISVECGLTLNLLEKFRRNELDLVLLKMAVPDDMIEGTEVWSEKLEWVSRTGYPIEGIVPLVVSPDPCVYRRRGIEALNRAHKKWSIMFSSHSYTSMMAAVQAGLGITILPRKLIPEGFNVVTDPQLPTLEDTHISLIKQPKSEEAVDCFELFILEKFKD